MAKVSQRYSRVMGLALASLSLEPGAAAELSKQLRGHIVEAFPPDASDDMVAAVLAALGRARHGRGRSGSALAADEPSSAVAVAPGCRPGQAHAAAGTEYQNVTMSACELNS